VANHEATGI